MKKDDPQPEEELVVSKSESDKPKITNLFGAATGLFDDFDLEKERKEAWGNRG